MRYAIATMLLALTLAGCGADDPAGPADARVAAAQGNAATAALTGGSTQATSRTPCSATASLSTPADGGLLAAPAAASSRAATVLAQRVRPAGADASERAHVNGSGGAVITDFDGNTFPAHFAIAAAVASDGTATGHVNFEFSREFGQVWGVVPVDGIHIAGRVTSGEVLASQTVVLEGTLTEREYAHGAGVVFIEENSPFRIAAGGALGPNTLTLRWCLLPDFLVRVTNGTLQVRS